MDSLNQWFVDPIKNHYFDFEGRSTVQQYWMFTLWCFIFSILLEVIGQDIASTLFSLALLFPGLAIGARRLHDIGKSGWWQLLWLIPIIGWIILIVFLVTKGESGINGYGEDPRVSVVPTSAMASASASSLVPPVAPTLPAVSEEAPADTNHK